MVSIPFDNITPVPVLDQIPLAPSSTPDERPESSFDEYLKPTRDEDPAAADTQSSGTDENSNSDDTAQQASDSTRPVDHDEEKQSVEEGEEEQEQVEASEVAEETVALKPTIDTPELSDALTIADVQQPLATEVEVEIAAVDVLQETQAATAKQVEIETPTAVALEQEDLPRDAKDTHNEIKLDIEKAAAENSAQQPQVNETGEVVTTTEGRSTTTKRKSTEKSTSSEVNQEQQVLPTAIELKEQTAIPTAVGSAESRDKMDKQAPVPATTGLDSVNAAAGRDSKEGQMTPIARLEQHLLSRGQSPTSEAEQTSPTDQARFVQRVARAFESARNQDGILRLRLSPPELGSLRLEVKLQSGVMTARIETETNAARTLLLESLPVLRERLSEQGIRVERFEVDVPDRQQGELPDETGDNSKRQSGSSQQETPLDEGLDESLSDPRMPRAGDDNLNVIV